MLFISLSFVFFDSTLKKKFLLQKLVGGLAPPLPTPPRPQYLRPCQCKKFYWKKVKWEIWKSGRVLFKRKWCLLMILSIS